MSLYFTMDHDSTLDYKIEEFYEISEQTILRLNI
jgi:hypothetical protein